MSCNEYVQLISEEIDGEIEESKALFLMRHLVICDYCRNEYNSTLGLQCLIKEDIVNSRIDIPADFPEKVMSIIESGAESDIGLQGITAGHQSNSRPGIFEKLKDVFTLPAPALSWSLAASFALALSLSFALLYNPSTQNNFPTVQLTNAKVIEAKVLEAANSAGVEEDEDEFNYYVKQHAQAVYSRPSNTPAGFRKANLIHAGYNSRIGGQ